MDSSDLFTNFVVVFVLQFSPQKYGNDPVVLVPGTEKKQILFHLISLIVYGRNNGSSVLLFRSIHIDVGSKQTLIELFFGILCWVFGTQNFLH